MITRVAVLRGGVGAEHDVSMQTGAEVLAHLRAQQDAGALTVVDVFINRAGEWYVRGVQQSPEKALSYVDVVWNALHGEYGEDGTVQRILERLGVPYTGSAPYGAALSMNKALAKETLKRLGILVPRAAVLHVSPTIENDILSVFRSFPQPSIVKPLNAGSSLGTSLAQSFTEFNQAVRAAFSYASSVMVEEYIHGREATCGIIEGFRNEPLYALPTVEIALPPSSRLFDYDAKCRGAAYEECPGNFSQKENAEIQRIARAAHQALGLRHYSRTDMIVTPRGVYFLEANALPGMAAGAPLPTSFKAVGVSVPEFINHILNLAV